MKSPFPGMDPFIEGCGLWGDFRDALVQDIKNALGQQVPRRYLVRTGERGYVVLANKEDEQTHSFIPDVSVASKAPEVDANGGVAVAEPTTAAEPYSIRAFVEDEYRETFVEILDADREGKLVTCIEVLSPSNKKPNSPGWELYQRKRQGLLAGGSANLVEIDLLRGGQRMPMADPWRPSPYRLLVARKNRAPYCSVWSANSLHPVRSIPVPLLKPDPDVPLDLQALIDAIYERCRYEDSIQYTRTLTPPLLPEETAWLQQHMPPPA